MRTFRENFIIGYAGKMLMINMVSFRRKIISAEEYLLLKGINSKDGSNLLDTEAAFLKLLYDEKQLLSDELIAWYDNQRELTFNKPCYRIGSITINLSYDCNFHCKYCYQRDFNYYGKYLLKDDIDRIYDYVVGYNKAHNNLEIPDEVVISGGESLLERNVDSINRICEKFSQCKLKLFTNGVNIIKFKDRIDFTKFNEIQVSLDGMDEIINSINENSSKPFNKIIEGILYLISKGIKVCIISMATKESLKYFDDFLETLHKNNIVNNELVTVRFSFVVNYGEKYTLDTSFYDAEDYIKLRQEVIKKSSRYKNVFVDRLYDLNFMANVIYRSNNERMDGRIAMCRTDKGFPLLFGPNREIYWCTCTNLNKKLASLDDDFAKLDESSMLNELLNRNIYKMDKCKNCIYRFVCSAGCPLYAIHSYESGYSYHCGIFEHPMFEEKAELFLGM